MYNFLFGNKVTITEKTLLQNNINIINKKDLVIDRKNCIAITGSGKFYTGTLRNEPISIKIIDISKEESILNEFIYWQEFKKNDCFLEFYGASLTGNEGWLIFESFSLTLEDALSKRTIKDDLRIKFAKQASLILETLQTNKKMTKDLRPGVFGITDKLKLIDFGYLIGDNLNNIELIQKQRNKYIPPETLQYLIEELCFDIWSFGCLLIDIFSKEQPIFRINLSLEDVYKFHNLNQYPIIPNDINGLIKDIITRCLDKNHENRIKIDELMLNLNIYFDNVIAGDNTLDNISFDKNSELEDTYKYVYDLESNVIKMNNIITNELMDKSINLKNIVEHGHELTSNKLTENYTHIKEILSELSVGKFNLMDQIKETIITNILSMQQYYGSAMADFLDSQNIINDMKTNLNSLVKLQKPEKYINLTESLKNNKILLENIIKKYSDKHEFDNIMVPYNQNKEIVEMFKSFIQNEELLMVDIISSLKKNQENFNKNKNIIEISQKLGIETKIEITSSITSIKEIYAKVQENSNIIIVYDIEKKRFIQKKTQFAFNKKCYSFFKDNSIYVSGGLENKKQIKDFYTISISINYDELLFEKNILPDMIFPHSSHIMVNHNDYLIVIAGNTNKNEIYDNNKWNSLPDLPISTLNPTVCISNDILYCFSGSVGIDTLDRIFKLSLNNITKILTDKNWEDILYWESVEYYFTSSGRLRRGMASLNSDHNSIILFGGFDYDNIYDDFYNLELFKRRENDDEEFNYFPIDKYDITLPIKTYFNSNIMRYGNYLVIIDGYNNAIELDLRTNEFFYYT